MKTVVALIFRKRDTQFNFNQNVNQFVTFFTMVACNYQFSNYGLLIFFLKLHVNVTTNLQSLKYIYLLLSGGVKHKSTFPCGKSLLQDKKLTNYLCRTMSTLVKSEKSISSWIHSISNKRNQAPDRPPFLTPHQQPTLESSICPNKIYCSSKIFTQFNSLPLTLLYNMVLWHAGPLHYNKLKQVYVRLIQYHPFLCVSTSYKLKYVPFDFFINYAVIKYGRADRLLGPPKYDQDRKWEKN